MKNENYGMEYVPNWQEKLAWRLYPPTTLKHPEIAHSKDWMFCDTTVEISWIDRLRLLFSGRLQVRSCTITENVIGNNKTESVFQALPPLWMDRYGDSLKSRKGAT